VLVANDQMALGVLSAFHQQQISIPAEKSVIGYDGTYESSFFYPALTVSLDLDLQGKEAVRRILDSSEDNALRMSSILPARLVVRQSTGRKGRRGKTYRRWLSNCARSRISWVICNGVGTSGRGCP
jgi:DNA-binding LacI/PurR family transcriptional regulator